MAPSHSERDHLHIVIDYFTRQKTRTVPEPLAETLRSYLAGLPAAERRRIIPVNKRKQSKGHAINSRLTPFEQEALAYFKAKQDLRNGRKIDDVRILRMFNALVKGQKSSASLQSLNTLLRSSSRSFVACLTLEGIEPQSVQHALTPGSSDTPLIELIRTYQSVHLSTDLHNLASKILKLLIHHEFKLLKNIGIDNEAQQQRMLEHTGLTLEGSEDIRRMANGWLRFVSVFGLGALSVVQAQADEDFEKNVNLAFLNDFRDFLEQRCGDIWTDMQDLNKAVGSLILQINARYAHDQTALLDGAEALSKYLRKAFERVEDTAHPISDERNDASPMNALVTVAIAAAAKDGRRSLTLGSESQANESNSRTLRVNRLELVSASGVRNEGIGTEQGRMGALRRTAPVQAITYGQRMQPPGYSNIQSSLDCAQSGFPFELGDAVTNAGAQSLSTRWWPAVGSCDLSDNAVTNLPTSSDLTGFNQAAMVNEGSTNVVDDWVRTVEDVYATFGDGVNYT